MVLNAGFTYYLVDMKAHVNSTSCAPGALKNRGHGSLVSQCSGMDVLSIRTELLKNAHALTDACKAMHNSPTVNPSLVKSNLVSNLSTIPNCTSLNTVAS